MRIVLVVLLLLCNIPASAATQAKGEIAIRAEVSDSAKQALLGADFAALEKQSNLYRTKKSRTPSGQWKLAAFYSGISGAIDEAKGSADGFDKIDAIVEKWVKLHPKSPSAHIVQSMVLSGKGWKIRGGSYAHSVKPESWAPFKEKLAQARENLERYKVVAAKDPNWYGEMLGLARDEGWDRARFDVLFDEALKREPQYYQNYFVALLYLLPKWHGDIDEIDAFVRSAVARTSKVEGQGMYARLYWYAAQVQFEDEDLFADTRADWSLMKAGFEDVIARYPDAWNINNYAKFACQARDRKKFGELLPRVKKEIVPEAWKGHEELRDCIVWSNRVPREPLK